VCDEKLIAQLPSRRKLYDSKGREKLESKADLKARGVESPDRADALILSAGSVFLAIIVPAPFMRQIIVRIR
jgi:phage terminase large subunit